MKSAGRVSAVRFGDALLAFSLVLLLALLIRKAPREKGSTFELYSADSLVQQGTLSDSLYTIQTSRGSVIVKTTDSSALVVSSSCPEKICAHSKPITHAGEEIICVPNRVVLRISGDRSFDADIIAR